MKSRIIPYVFMIILLAAHFSRSGHDLLAILSLPIPLLFFVKQKWVIIALEIVAYLSALVWLFGAYQYIQIRSATGDDWVRLLIIMGCVALYSAWSGFFLRSGKIKEVYGMNE
ncbi:MAG: hypothetical protein HOD43_10365 [Candidatus Marinimicrobia bacterium]|jgi:hypothetical protein|nr:hypothetical protein [Candidatus Neomarinimicrobiota bacterium]MBT3631032.1 hypothetical protein [Candidatus Neomarinimicrobiota bacterium]MBT3825672.1 hypothetical protein [Candidatus Neomarinimicrobiota bacterium]MBT4130584.1 hypothetical protein [Candidatus Neomarinimicrobiota bacterium]MBT4296195.1 hypothetical protein [Candidatus Neomarinimicrobiota bacterium]